MKEATHSTLIARGVSEMVVTARGEMKFHLANGSKEGALSPDIYLHSLRGINSLKGVRGDDTWPSLPKRPNFIFLNSCALIDCIVLVALTRL